MTGAIFTATKDYRNAFWFPLALIVLGVIILLMVDVDAGRDQARQFAEDKKKEKLLKGLSQHKGTSSTDTICAGKSA